MFVSLERPRRADRPRDRSPYVRIALVVVAVHLLLFIFTPPFHFQPYQLEAEEITMIEDVPVVVIPKPPKEVPIPFVRTDPFQDEEGDDEDIPDYNTWEYPPAPPPTPAPLPNPGFIAFDQPPEPVTIVKPNYPGLARQAGIEGTVIVKVTIDIEGKVIAAVVLSSDVTESMDREAVKAALRCTFNPAKQRDKPVRVDVVIPFQFRLQR
jgi:protein TonB